MVDLCFMWNTSFCHDVSHSTAIAGNVFFGVPNALFFFLTLAATKSALHIDSVLNCEIKASLNFLKRAK